MCHFTMERKITERQREAILSAFSRNSSNESSVENVLHLFEKGAFYEPTYVQYAIYYFLEDYIRLTQQKDN